MDCCIILQLSDAAGVGTGDGLADIVGRQWGGSGSWVGGSLPHNRNKVGGWAIGVDAIRK
jgi:hypothetical protein